MRKNPDVVFENMLKSAEGLAKVVVPDELAKMFNRLAVAAVMPECPSAVELTAMEPVERWRMVNSVHGVASFLRTDVAFLLALLTSVSPELVREAIDIANKDLDAVAHAIVEDYDIAAKIAASDRRGPRINKANDN